MREYCLCDYIDLRNRYILIEFRRPGRYTHVLDMRLSIKISFYLVRCCELDMVNQRYMAQELVMVECAHVVGILYCWHLTAGC